MLQSPGFYTLPAFACYQLITLHYPNRNTSAKAVHSLPVALRSTINEQHSPRHYDRQPTISCTYEPASTSQNKSSASVGTEVAAPWRTHLQAEDGPHRGSCKAPGMPDSACRAQDLSRLGFLGQTVGPNLHINNSNRGRVALLKYARKELMSYCRLKGPLSEAAGSWSWHREPQSCRTVCE